MLKLTGKAYTPQAHPWNPNARHNIDSWIAILMCLSANGWKATREQLEAAIPQDHPAPTNDCAKNVTMHIEWHIKQGRLEEC